jgi:hypothetical protein
MGYFYRDEVYQVSRVQRGTGSALQGRIEKLGIAG